MQPCASQSRRLSRFPEHTRNAVKGRRRSGRCAAPRQTTRSVRRGRRPPDGRAGPRGGARRCLTADEPARARSRRRLGRADVGAPTPFGDEDQAVRVVGHRRMPRQVRGIRCACATGEPSGFPNPSWIRRALPRGSAFTGCAPFAREHPSGQVRSSVAERETTPGEESRGRTAANADTDGHRSTSPGACGSPAGPSPTVNVTCQPS